MPFRDRAHTGQQLALRLAQWADPGNLINLLVLALPHGGVPVAAQIAQIAQTPHAPPDGLVARKIGAPGHPEAAISAIVDEEPPHTGAGSRASSGRQATSSARSASACGMRPGGPRGSAPHPGRGACRALTNRLLPRDPAPPGTVMPSEGDRIVVLFE